MTQILGEIAEEEEAESGAFLSKSLNVQISSGDNGALSGTAAATPQKKVQPLGLTPKAVIMQVTIEFVMILI